MRAPSVLMRFLTFKWVVKLLSGSWMRPFYRFLYILNEKRILAKNRILPRAG